MCGDFCAIKSTVEVRNLKEIKGDSKRQFFKEERGD